ncbi:histidine phosphatase family protein [Acinetobacter sp. NIPH 2699]|uniref:histidine phosphatase family protein n=1 Tax=Acinetobacter sp. NIPH 2699 TaxID=2923433 RepID=UPI001F4A2A55|nr:histidine phosphatase family protein [Acinetobacter sp. NIPH 2699]MCH7337413.1 histidine phosphatase family protein [Acinetobacter sp. NIPH 2699]
MSIFLIRHAESEANINGRALSHASIALSTNGRMQAERLCTELPKIDHVIISKYLRTYQTAEPLLQKYKITSEIDQNLHEFSYLSERKCANTNLDDRKTWVDAYWAKMDCHYRDADDAESFADLYFRVQQFHEKIQRLASHYVEKNLVIFSHGQFLQLLLTLIQQPQSLSRELMQNFRSDLIHRPIKNTEIFLFEK